MPEFGEYGNYSKDTKFALLYSCEESQDVWMFGRYKQNDMTSGVFEGIIFQRKVKHHQERQPMITNMWVVHEDGPYVYVGSTEYTRIEKSIAGGDFWYRYKLFQHQASKPLTKNQEFDCCVMLAAALEKLNLGEIELPPPMVTK